MLYLIEHRTELTFTNPVREHLCELRIAPHHPGQAVLELELESDPQAEMRAYADAWGNTVHWFGVIEAHERLVTTMRARVETKLVNPFDYEAVPVGRERAWIEEALWREPRLWDYLLHRSPATPALNNLEVAGKLEFPEKPETQPVIEAVQSAMEWIAETLTYETGATKVHASLADVLTTKAGVCQDFAHLLVALVRSWGVPARYAMGYQDPTLAADDDEEVVTAGATHAWAQVLVPGAGWRGFDATNSLVVNDTYVTVAVGRDSTDAAPQRGVFKGDGGSAEPDVRVQMAREQ